MSLNKERWAGMRKIRLLFIEDNRLFGEGVTMAAMLVLIVLLRTSLLNAEDTPTPTGYIDPFSTTSLMVELLSKKESIGTATAFVVEHKSKKYLVSNTHVFSGWDHFHNKAADSKGRIPDEIKIYYHHRSTIGKWTSRTEKLRNDDGSIKWFEAKQPIDVAALGLTNLDEKLRIYPFDLKLADTDMLAMVGMPASIIGFPGGLTASGLDTREAGRKAGIISPGFPIWKVGYIATDPDWDVDQLPLFLIDSTTRAGMCGSPVVLLTQGAYITKKRRFVIGISSLFLGIYSAQVDPLELGYVWKPRALIELLSKAPLNGG